MKQCIKCGLLKPPDEFEVNVCKRCAQDRRNAWRRRKDQDSPRTMKYLPQDATRMVQMQAEAIKLRIAKHVIQSSNTTCHEWEYYARAVWSGKMRKGKAYPTIAVTLDGKQFKFSACRIVAALYHNLNLNDSLEAACHSCDNPPCVNPDHIYKGDFSSNHQDAIARGLYKAPKGTVHYRAKLNENDVRTIRVRLGNGDSCNSIARTYGVAAAAISSIKRGESWAHLR